MTNAEYYLKEGTNIDELRKDINSFMSLYGEFDTTDFFNEQRQPTLTEDERVILRNMKVKGSTAEYIRRVENTGYLQVYARCGVVGANFFNIDIYSHLFQFIKERRRI